MNPPNRIPIGVAIILAEHTVLIICILSIQRIKIRCYSIYRGYASIYPLIISKLTHTIRHRTIFYFIFSALDSHY